MSNRIVGAIAVVVAIFVAIFLAKMVFGLLTWGLPILIALVIGYFIGRASNASKAMEQKTKRLERVA